MKQKAFSKKYKALATVMALTAAASLGTYNVSYAAEQTAPPAVTTMKKSNNNSTFDPSDGTLLPPPPPDGNFQAPQTQESDASTLTAEQAVDGATEDFDGLDLKATKTDESAFLVRLGGTASVTNSTLHKTGDSSNADDSNFSGKNAVFLSSQSTAKLTNSKLYSDADGANAVFSTGKDSVVDVENVTIHTKNNSSRGLDATYGGTINAKNVDITTEGAHCGALATDRGEGNVIVDTATINTSGEGSPCIYSTGNIQLTNGTGVATGSEIAVVEGKNSITLNNADLTGYKQHGVMLYQSFSGDAGVGEATFTAKDSTLNNKSDGPMFYITNTTATANLENTKLRQSGDTLVNVTSDRWGKAGSNGGNFTLNATNQALNGKVLANSISEVTLNLQDKSTFTGSINEDKAAKSATISLSKDSVWNVTSNSYVTKITDQDSRFKNINSNGHNIYYDRASNANLNGKTFKLKNDGYLTPAK